MKPLVVLSSLVCAASLAAQGNPLTYTARPTSAAITPADLMSRVYPFAHDSMMGRQAGTPYHDKGVEYIARELARIGLRPAGDNGTYFQQVPLSYRNVASDLKFTVDGREYASGTDFLLRDANDFGGAAARAMQDAEAVYGGVFGDPAGMLQPARAAGKVVVFTVPRGWQANRGGLTQYYLNHAVAIVVATMDSMPDETKVELLQPSQGLATATPAFEVPMFFYATRAMGEAMIGGPFAGATVGQAGKKVSGAARYTFTPTPGSRNVVAVLPGSDPRLAGQYVAIGSHTDHVGMDAPVDHDSLYAFYHVVRPGGADDDDKEASAGDWPRIQAKLDSLRRANRPRQDSIFNGADDNASGSMAMLEVAEAFAGARVKPRRSIIFVWHVAEELGLFGSEHFTDHPTVPRDSIVAQINIDMIGRGGAQDTPGGGPGYLQLIGSRRLSSQLGELVETEGRKFTPAFRYDYQFDANGHPQQYYCRSDHYNYARYGIPVVFMSTGGHPEYHQVTDEPQYLDYEQLARVTQLVFNTASTIANLDARLAVDGRKPDPRAPCVQ